MVEGLECVLPQGSGIAFQHRAWALAGRRHAFFGAGLDVSSRGVAQSWPIVSKTLGVTRLLLVKQVHGTQLIELDARFEIPQEAGPVCIGEADGIIVHQSPLDDECSGRTGGAGMTAIGVKTADCMPILISGSTSSAVVHAGWRGLAAGVVERALALMRADAAEPVHLLVGPCAGGEHYEVGKEVVEALGASAVSRQGRSIDHYVLDLQETLVQRVKQLPGDICVNVVKTCTISSSEFYSHRREGATAGRNLSALVIG